MIKEYLQSNKHKSRSVLRTSLAHVAIEAAYMGSLALLNHFRKPLEVRLKGVANYVSEADLAAESAIVQVIQDAFPKHAILSEESHSDRADAANCWIIDPLDGTNNFIHGIFTSPFLLDITNPAKGFWESLPIPLRATGTSPHAVKVLGLTAKNSKSAARQD